ncbi:hypothetical protein D3C71_1983780 [compost metagenome]
MADNPRYRSLRLEAVDHSKTSIENFLHFVVSVFCNQCRLVPADPLALDCLALFQNCLGTSLNGNDEIEFAHASTFDFPVEHGR